MEINMKFMNKLVPVLVCLGLSSGLFARSANHNYPAINSVQDVAGQKDLWAVRDWLKSKRVALNNKGGDLSISGDVRAQWRNITESLGTYNVVQGPTSNTPATASNSASKNSNNEFGVEFRLYFDYRADRTWASVKLDFDNAAGVWSGQSGQISLTRANMGYHVYDDGMIRIDLLMGRQRLYDLYDSQLQFNSTADGFTITYNMAIENWFDFLVHGGGYIVDTRVNHAFWVLEAGLYDICDTGAYFEYSYVNWEKTSKDFFGIYKDPRWQFIINQFTLGYVFNPELLGIDMRLFGAFLWNCDASKRELRRISAGREKNLHGNLGGYVTLQLGNVEKANDWAFQAQWQLLQPQCVPDFDVAGIGRGNSLGLNIYQAAPSPTTLGFGNGNGNYNGFGLSALFAVTDELVMEARLQRTLSAKKKVGRDAAYTNFVLAAVYGF
jgi:hypothetical protein